MSWHGVPPAARRRRRGRWVALTFLVVALLVIAGVGGTALYGRQQLEPVASDHSQPVTITVHQGESLDNVIDDLAGHGLIRSRTWFGLWAKVKGLGEIAAGRYSLDSGMGASAIIARLQQLPDVSFTKVLVTEGMTSRQMAARVGQANIPGITADQYLNEVQHGAFDEPFLQGRPAGGSLEGFLYPDTFEVAQGTTAHQLVQMQLDDFAQKAYPILKAKAPTGLTPYQTLTLASIVERETAFADDRPKVAGVIINRLKASMPLQDDPTVTYGLGKDTGDPTAQDLKTDTPFNTYLHSGLPPTPISNPGLPSIQASLAPADVPYIYFVSDGCGRAHFAVTGAEHQKNVDMYLGKPCATPTP